MSNTSTQFKKGIVPWNKGTKGVMKVNSGSFKLGMEAKNKIGTIKICTICSTNYPVRGIKRRETSKFCSVACRGLSMRGKPSPMTGKKTSDETRKKQSGPRLSIRGENHYNWKGGTGTKRHQEMQQSKYLQWREAVFVRDNFTCQICKDYGVAFHADHIERWADNEELRYNVDNGRTLCVPCHYYITFKRKMPLGAVWCNYKMTRKRG